MDRSDPEQRFYYVGPMFRRERPQKGRFRQFSQFGVEIFGRADAATDAELMMMVDELRRDLGLELNFEINSLGDAECRPRYRQAVLEYGRAHLAELCEDCRHRLERNPLRLLDCKIDVKLAEAAPKSQDYLCDNCRAHFATVRELLTDAGVPHVVNPRLVRGLDYYTRTTFEVVSTAVGAQSAVAAGGRYDGLVEALGGAAGRRHRLRDRRRSPRAGSGCGPIRFARRRRAGRAGRRRDAPRDEARGRDARGGTARRAALARARAQGAAAPRRQDRRALRGDYRRQRARARRAPRCAI